MAITAVFYVYAPLTGTVTNLDDWACGSEHTTIFGTSCGFSQPTDIQAPSTTAVYFKGSSNINSILVQRYDGVCGDPSTEPESIKWAVVVNLYANPNAECYIGTVVYAHLDDRILVSDYSGCPNSPPRGDLINYPWQWGSTGIRLGVVAPAPSKPTTCSSGPHVHCEAYLAQRGPLYCGQRVSGGYSWLYKFYLDDSAC